MIALFDVVGSVKAVPAHTADTCVNIGVVASFTVTVIVALFAQAILGVNVYVVVVLVFTAGDHVPAIALVDVAGSVNAVPAQTGATCVNVGVIALLTATVIVALFAHAMLGVNV